MQKHEVLTQSGQGRLAKEMGMAGFIEEKQSLTSTYLLPLLPHDGILRAGESRFVPHTASAEARVRQHP